MKQKFTLIIVLMLITLLVSAQETFVPVNNKHGKKTFKSHVDVLDHELAKNMGNNFKDIDQNLAVQQEKPEYKNKFLKNASYKKPIINSELLATEESVFLLDSIIDFTFISDTDSLFDSRRIHVYDENGIPTFTTYYSWDSDINDWVFSMKNENSYYANGNKIVRTWYHWDSRINDWVVFWKYEHSYDANGNQILLTSYSWDSGINDWVGRIKFEYSYGANGKEILRVGYAWDSATNGWVVDFKNEFSYDAKGNQTLRVNYSWDSAINDWEVISKFEYSYDANGNEILRLVYDWNSGINDWVDVAKFVYSYDANHNLTLEARYDWDSGLNNWQLYQKLYNYYRKINTAIIEMSANDLLVYPNPAKDYITIQTDKNIENITFELFDMQGRKVLCIENPSGKTISLKGVIPGLYLYNIIVDGVLQSGKLIKE